MVDRLLGKRVADANGHLPADAGLILDTTLLDRRRKPWEVVQLARELKRPHSLEIIEGVFERFQELHGDRAFRDDPAVIGGIATLESLGPVVVVAQQRGESTEENIARNFGMPYPEGYRKAIRLYRIAEKFHLPLVTLVDTPGAYPGPEAEERGQAEAIAKSILVMTGLQTPIVAIIVGELIPEPAGGAHTDPQATIAAIKSALIVQLDRLGRVPIADLLSARYERYRQI